MSVAKPQLRFLLLGRFKKAFWIGIGTSIIAPLLYKFTVADPRIRKYETFIKTYDVEKDFDRMVKAGVFHCINSDGEVVTPE